MRKQNTAIHCPFSLVVLRLFAEYEYRICIIQYIYGQYEPSKNSTIHAFTPQKAILN